MHAALIQRVTSASVAVDAAVIGRHRPRPAPWWRWSPATEAQFARMAQRLLGYRVFDDGSGRMNRSLAETGGGLLLVSQFTLAADTRSGMRPGFSTAAPPDEAERGFNRLVELCRESHAQGWKPAASGPIW
jgi:D-tyrosyl-tRNA(Tyr) deacylase